MPKHVWRLQVEHFLDINEQIRLRSLKEEEIEYSGHEIYPIRLSKLHALCQNVPN